MIGEPLTLAGARLLAAQVQRERLQGGDPVAAHKAKRHRLRAPYEADGQTFAAAALMFIKEHARPKTRRWRETARLLGIDYDDALVKGGLAERWKIKPLRTIDERAILLEIDAARRRAPGRARAQFSALSTMFNWLQRARLVESNPCARVHRPRPPGARNRVLSGREIRLFWKGCDELGAPFGALFKVMLLTACRLREVAGMQADELTGTMWTIPGSRTKNKRAHLVPLAPAVIDIIADMPRIENCSFLFSTMGTSPVSGWSKTKARPDKLVGITPWRLHDLRRTAVTGMAELGIPADVIELVVNHVSGARASVAGVYNRSELLVQRRDALERWAVYIGDLVSPEPGQGPKHETQEKEVA